MGEVPTTDQKAKPWLQRNLSNLVVFGAIVLVLFMQWPMVKGLIYRATGGAQDQISWRPSYDAAVAEARTSGKPLLLSFGATWCPPCQVMKHEVWPDKEVEALANGSFIPVRIDIDHEQDTSVGFRVDTIPAIISVSSTGDILKRSGFLSASQMVGFMNDSLAAHTATPQRPETEPR